MSIPADIRCLWLKCKGDVCVMDRNGETIAIRHLLGWWYLLDAVENKFDPILVTDDMLPEVAILSTEPNTGTPEDIWKEPATRKYPIMNQSGEIIGKVRLLTDEFYIIYTERFGYDIWARQEMDVLCQYLSQRYGEEIHVQYFAPLHISNYL